MSHVLEIEKDHRYYIIIWARFSGCAHIVCSVTQAIWCTEVEPESDISDV